MATKTISTRIKNKVDNYATWASSTNKLLNGEIALVRVPTGDTYTNPVTGKTEPVVELLMKVGDGTTAFSSLPWLSAKASDVYNWAKNPAAKDVPVAVIKGTDTTATSDTLGNWLKTVYDKGVTNASSISANTAAITKLNGADSVTGSVAQKIKAAIDALDVSDTAVTGQFITKVSEANGKISVSRAAITESDLPSISASKIIVDSNNTTLATKIGTMDAAITANTNKLAGHTDDAINTLITNKINALDSTSSGSGSFVTNVTQTNGKVTVTKGNLPEATTSTAGIAKLGANGGAATYASVFGTDGTGGLNKTVSDLSSEVASLKTSVAGGVHFIGTTTTVLTDGSTTGPVTIDSKTHTPSAGDVVLYSNKEFIWTGSTWEELGDLSRVGTLETLTGSIHATNATANHFATHIAKVDNKLVVKTAQPTAANIKYGTNSTVDAKLSSIDAEIAKKMDTHEHPYAADTHAHGNITNSGTITQAALTSTSGVTGVVVTDGSNKVTRMSASTVRSLIGAGTSSLTIGTTADTAAAGNHTHSDYAADITALEAKVDVAKVSEAISGAINNLDFTAPTASGNATAFIDSVSQENGVITATKKNIQSASTSAAGIVKLSSSTSSSSESLAATPKAVKSAYDKGNDAQTRVAAVEGNYVKYNNSDNKLYIGKDGADEIIFDCGGAE